MGISIMKHMSTKVFICTAAGLLLGCFSLGAFAQAAECSKKIYLTFDTGNMAVAEKVAEILKRQNVRATFFLANEKTLRVDFSLDDSWKSYWQERVKEGHHFGSHTLLNPRQAFCLVLLHLL